MKNVSVLEIIATFLAYTLFVLGSSLAIVLLPLFKFIPLKEDRKKGLFHGAIYHFFRFLVYLCPVLDLNIINPTKETFEKPAIIIANHQSMLDIFMVLMHTPKTIIMTKGWVWNNTILGSVARYADYYCADEGYENLKDKASGKIAQGYSIVIFPEGKRSYTGEIDRFHKGAFYLAEELKTDILPIIIHGTKQSVPRGKRIIRKSLVTLKYLPRIRPEDNSFGDNYTDRSKNIRHYMIKEYEKI
jgi:uncharacterized protein